MRGFSSLFRVLLTGTPIQNNLQELWALLNFLQPDLFSSVAEFDAVFNSLTLKQEGGDGASPLRRLQRMIRPFMFRRVKAQVLNLPPKEKRLEYAVLTEMQRELYLKTLDQDKEVRTGTTVDRGRLMNMMMQLRKVANHPWLFQPANELQMDAEQRMMVSGKMMLLDSLLKEMKQSGSRVLIFSQMTKMLNILEEHLIWRRYSYCRIDGKTKSTQRTEQIDAFNREESEHFVFLLSTRAGGVGINLYTADTVIFYDSDWNPQMDLQAMDRAHRLGQKRQVTVVRLITEDTVEVKMLNRAEMKLHLDSMVIQQGRGHQYGTGLESMTAIELTNVIQYGVDKIRRPAVSKASDEDIADIGSLSGSEGAECSDHVKDGAAETPKQRRMTEIEPAERKRTSNELSSDIDQFLDSVVSTPLPRKKQKSLVAHELNGKSRTPTKPSSSLRQGLYGKWGARHGFTKRRKRPSRKKKVEPAGGDSS